MGLDGGTIITRSDVLRGQSWKMAQQDTTKSSRGGAVGASTTYRERALDKATEKSVAWSCCSLSGEALAGQRVVSDRLGRLYRRDSVVELLLARRSMFTDSQSVAKFYNQQRVAGDKFAHLQSLKDVFDVTLTPEHRDPQPASTPQGQGQGQPATTTLAAAVSASSRQTGHAGASSSSSAAAAGDSSVQFVCPVTGLACERFPCSALRPCGHVLSDRALAQCRDSACPVCSKAYDRSKNDVVPINGTSEQIAELQRLLEARQEQVKAKKEKRKDQDMVSGSANANAHAAGAEAHEPGHETKRAKKSL